MIIRSCRQVDAEHEAAVYNAAAAKLPGFRPLSADEVRRGANGRPEPGTRFYAEDAGQVVGYATFDPTGRVSLGFNDLNVTLPSTVLVDRHGKVAAVVRDTVDQADLTELIRKVAAES